MVPRQLTTGKRTVARLGGLRWRLTIVYALVTLVAAGTMSAATAVAQTARGVVPADQAGVPATLAKSASAATPYLAEPAPDPETIRTLVTMPLMEDLAHQARADPWAIAVFDSQGTLVTADSCTSQRAAATSAACRTEAQSRAAALLADGAGRRAVQSAVRDLTAHVRTGTASGRGFAAATIPGAKQPGGAIVAIFNGGVPATPRRHLLGSFLSQWTSSWSPAWLPLSQRPGRRRRLRPHHRGGDPAGHRSRPRPLPAARATDTGHRRHHRGLEPGRPRTHHPCRMRRGSSRGRCLAAKATYEHRPDGRQNCVASWWKVLGWAGGSPIPAVW